jgi:hypothetical protein
MVFCPSARGKILAHQKFFGASERFLPALAFCEKGSATRSETAERLSQNKQSLSAFAVSAFLRRGRANFGRFDGGK